MKTEIGRFSLAGLANTAVGYTVIFLSMALGLGPYCSNIAGYGVGFLLSFWVNKIFVFRSQGKACGEMARFLVCFFTAYIGNLIVLHLLLMINLNTYICQVMAGVVYVMLMFGILKLWVFTGHSW